jgi:hypothetical protein
MNIVEELKFTGELSIIVRGPEGNIKQAMTVPNLVVTVGKNHIASRLVGTTSAVMGWMGVGTGIGVTPALGDTILNTEVARVALASYTSSSNAVTASALFSSGTPAGTNSITEAGLFNAATSGTGTLLAHTTFPAVSKAPGDSLSISWTITIS